MKPRDKGYVIPLSSLLKYLTFFFLFKHFLKAYCGLTSVICFWPLSDRCKSVRNIPLLMFFLYLLLETLIKRQAFSFYISGASFFLGWGDPL